MSPLAKLCCLAIGYLFGNLLAAELAARIFAHKSVFEVGDGNPGMANVGAHLGVPAAAVTLGGDVVKTILAFVVARALFPTNAAEAGCLATMAVTLGHNHPFWHHFQGGKGVTTTVSAIILSAPAAGIVASLLGMAATLVLGYLCVGAIAITLAYSLITWLFGLWVPFAWVSLPLLACMVMKHGWAVTGIREGWTKRASVSDEFWKRVGKAGGNRERG